MVESMFWTEVPVGSGVTLPLQPPEAVQVVAVALVVQERVTGPGAVREFELAVKEVMRVGSVVMMGGFVLDPLLEPLLDPLLELLLAAGQTPLRQAQPPITIPHSEQEAGAQVDFQQVYVGTQPFVPGGLTAIVTVFFSVKPIRLS